MVSFSFVANIADHDQRLHRRARVDLSRTRILAYDAAFLVVAPSLTIQLDFEFAYIA